MNIENIVTLTKAISMLTGIKEEKIIDYSKSLNPVNILEKPNTINPTKKQLNKINTLNDLIISYNIIKDFAHEGAIKFNSTKDIANYFKKLLGRFKDKERIYGAFLDKNNQIIDIKKLAEGTINTAAFYPREIVKEVIKNKCKSVVLCHNHPSGDPKPSKEDIDMTTNLENILEPLGVTVFDHIIVADNTYSSIKNKDDLNSTFKRHKFVAENESDNYNKANIIFNQHLNKLINCISETISIDNNKMNKLLNKINPEHTINNQKIENLLSFIKNPNSISTSEILSNSEFTKLKLLSDFLIHYEYIDENLITNRINFTEPHIIYDNYFDDKFNESEENALFVVFLDTRLKIIAEEIVTENGDDKLFLNPKELLIKALGHEAQILVVIHKIKDKNLNKVAEQGRKISQKLINIFSPIQIKVLDYIITDNERSFLTSLKEKGLMPYTVYGMADYKKIEIGENPKELSEELEQEELEL